jgi:hypothetical protein
VAVAVAATYAKHGRGIRTRKGIVCIGGADSRRYLLLGSAYGRELGGRAGDRIIWTRKPGMTAPAPATAAAPA